MHSSAVAPSLQRTEGEESGSGENRGDDGVEELVDPPYPG